MSEKLTEYDCEEMYNEMLDESYGVVWVAGMNYSTSRVLKDTDPIAWRVGLSDYIDCLITEEQFEVEGY